MKFLIISQNKSFSNSITHFLRKHQQHALVRSSIFDSVITTLEINFHAVIIDKSYITLSSKDIFIFAYSKKIDSLLLFFNSEIITPTILNNYINENHTFFKMQLQNKKTKKAYLLFQEYLNSYLKSFKTLLKQPLRKREKELISVLFLKSKPQTTKDIVKELWKDTNTKNIEKHKKTIYAYISRINSFCKSSNNIYIYLSHSKGKYYFKPLPILS
ncbi:MAG: hypothetical protein BKP49_08305 [Treponema sp. CETP13]|nr:MAG: hypothetical protein BKP49_08305 [Treponema sp. CETP13]